MLTMVDKVGALNRERNRESSRHPPWPSGHMPCAFQLLLEESIYVILKHRAR
jgi:hypothetical protein